MEWCRLTTGAVGVMKLAFGATYGYLALHESTRPDVVLCLIGAASSTICGGAVIGMAVYPRDFTKYNVAEVREEPTVAEVREEPTVAEVREEPTVAEVQEEPTVAEVREEPAVAEEQKEQTVDEEQEEKLSVLEMEVPLSEEQQKVVRKVAACLSQMTLNDSS